MTQTRPVRKHTQRAILDFFGGCTFESAPLENALLLRGMMSKSCVAALTAMTFCGSASADVSEYLNFNDNALPAGWNLYSTNGSNYAIRNGRMEAGQVDTYAWLSKDLPFESLTSQISLSYTENVSPVYWGMGSAVQLYDKLGSSIASLGFQKYGYGLSNLFISGAVGNTQIYSSFLPANYGNYYVNASFRNDSMALTATKTDGAVVWTSGTISIPGLALSSVVGARILAVTTTGDTAWIDNLSVQSISSSIPNVIPPISSLPQVGANLFKDISVLSGNVPGLWDNVINKNPNAIIKAADAIKAAAPKVSDLMAAYSKASTLTADGLVLLNPSSGLDKAVAAHDVVATLNAITGTDGQYTQLQSKIEGALTNTANGMLSFDLGSKAFSALQRNGVALATAGKLESAALSCATNACISNALYVNSLLFAQLSSVWAKFGDDPIDPNFSTLAIPADLAAQLPLLGSSGRIGFDKTLREQLKAAAGLASFIGAANGALDKYSGALNASNADSAVLQLNSLLRNVLQYTNNAATLSRTLSTFSAELGLASSDLKPLSAHAFKTFQGGLLVNGLPRDLIQFLVDNGFTPADLILLQSALTSIDPAMFTQSQSMDSLALQLSNEFASVSAVPVPELASWQLLAIGGILVAMVTHIRRRRLDFSQVIFH